MPTQTIGQENQAPTLELGSLAQVGLGTRAETQDSLTEFESLMGGSAKGILGFADDSTPEYSVGRVQADAPKFAAMERPVNWAIPLAWKDVSLADVAAGKHDAEFTAMANTIAENQTAGINPELYVRLGWEATNSYPWKVSSGQDGAFDPNLAHDYVDAFQHVATLFRAVDDRFRIEWNQNYSKADANGVFYDLNKIYPGDDFVDVVGVDAYNVSRFDGQDDPVSAWDYKANAPFGLNWLSSFAAAHGKPLAMTEWGIDSDNFGHYVDQLHEFARTNNVIYTNYWNADARTNGDDTLTDGSKPATAAAIADAFGTEGNAALIAGKQSGLIVEAGTDAKGHALAGTASAQIWGVKGDPDAGDTVTFDTAGWKAIDATHFQKNGVYGSAVLDTKTGIIAYTLDNSRDATDALADGDSVTDDFSVTVRDQAGASATEMASFVVRGADDVTHVGSAGNDVFDLEKAGDQVRDAGGGKDTVRTGFTHTLEPNVENLELLHTGDAWGTGNALDNSLVGNAADNKLRGLNGADVLHGKDGNDTLNGGAGADVMDGGKGNDVYSVDNAGDRVVESAGQGTDTVRTGLTHTLAPNVENLELLHTGDAWGTGNALDNSLVGNDADNKLRGLDGADVLRGMDGNDTLNGGHGGDLMYGGKGNDIYSVDNAGDRVVESAGQGTDTVRTGFTHTLAANVENLELLHTGDAWGTGNALDNTLAGNDANNTLRGLNGADFLYGMDGNDTLNGGAGADAMYGGKGNDAYSVDNAGDRVVEAAGQGTDTVRTGFTHTLWANVENLELLNTGDAWGTGNELDNTLLGNVGDNRLMGLDGADVLRGMDGNDTLNGGHGADLMYGGKGNDIYSADNAGDRVIESAGQGTDTVRTGFTHTLEANVENLELLHTGDAWGTGNALDNSLVGNDANNTLRGLDGADVLRGLDGNDRLDGGAGADVLYGGKGNDVFYFGNGNQIVAAAPQGATNVDAIADFDPATDRFELSHDVFTNILSGELAASAFATGQTAASTDQRVIYDDKTGALFYDSDGAGGADQFQFASLSPHLSVSSHDFFIV